MNIERTQDADRLSELLGVIANWLAGVAQGGEVTGRVCNDGEGHLVLVRWHSDALDAGELADLSGNRDLIDRAHAIRVAEVQHTPDQITAFLSAGWDDGWPEVAVFELTSGDTVSYGAAVWVDDAEITAALDRALRHFRGEQQP